MALLLLFPVPNLVNSGQTATTVASYEQLVEALQSEATEIFIEQSLEIDAAIIIPPGKTVKLASVDSLEASTLLRAGNYFSELFIVQHGATLTLANVIIDGNRKEVTAHASLIKVSGELFVEKGTVLQNNEFRNTLPMSYYSGGAIIIEKNGKVEMHGASLENNYALYDGGAIYVQGSFLANESSFKNNRAGNDGGAIALANNSETSLRNCKIQQNQTEFLGGGIAVDSGKLSIENCEISDNQSTYGGGIFAGGATIIKKTKIKNNKADIGGGINFYPVFSASFILEEVELIDNQAINGGGLAVFSDQNISLLKLMIKNNKATLGGGIYSFVGKIPLKQSTVVNNQADRGGGIYLQNGSCELIGSEVSNNRAVNGGGLYLTAIAQLHLVEATIVDNKATNNGGGIFAENYNSLYLRSDSVAVFSGNQAAKIFMPPKSAPQTEEQWQGTISTISVNIAGDRKLTVYNNCDINYLAGKELLPYKVVYHSNWDTLQEPLVNELLPTAVVKVAVNSFVAPLNMRFVAWNTKEDGSGQVYHSNEILEMPENDLMLYAIWEHVHHENVNTGDYNKTNNYALTGLVLSALAIFLLCFERKPYNID